MRHHPPVRPQLGPLIPLYRLALGLRELRLRIGWESVRQLQKPVVSIGNISAGGAGKTPLTIALAHALARRGIAVDVLSRGYGRQSRLPARVDPEGSAAAFGDEPLLIARATGLPVYVARQRYEAGRMSEAEETEVKVHLLDDGFQHRQLARVADIVLVSREDLRDHLLPAGNLREPVSALQRATILAIPAEEPKTESELRALGFACPIWRIRRRMDIPEILGPAVAFCGIARPDQFFSGLEQAGLDLAACKPFADHHIYQPNDLLQLANLAAGSRATLLTTEKDATRIGALACLLPPAVQLRTVGLVSEIEDEDAAIGWLLAHIQ
ncbi:MAG: tetraacyldisaccharide 4'-kinase [Terracidiphilus sp.]|nr:tetraacyldisaccharide 4'-kinase [Terracidiphilus sp.]